MVALTVAVSQSCKAMHSEPDYLYHQEVIQIYNFLHNLSRRDLDNIFARTPLQYPLHSFLTSKPPQCYTGFFKGKFFPHFLFAITVLWTLSSGFLPNNCFRLSSEEGLLPLPWKLQSCLYILLPCLMLLTLMYHEPTNSPCTWYDVAWHDCSKLEIYQKPQGYQNRGFI